VASATPSDRAERPATVDVKLGDDRAVQRVELVDPPGGAHYSITLRAHRSSRSSTPTRGHVRQRIPEQQGEQALCLAIVVNGLVARNTVYTQRVLDGLRAPASF
jgi:hypothetical protein